MRKQLIKRLCTQLLLFPLVIVFLSGCGIKYRSGKVPDELPWPLERMGDRKSVSVSISEEYIFPRLQIQPYDTTPQILALFNDSRLFSNVIDDRIKASNYRRIFVHITHNYTSPAWVIVLRLLTGYIIPLPDNHEAINVEIEVKNPEGKSMGIVKKSETEKVLISLLFIPIQPFIAHRPMLDLRDDVIRAAIAEAHDKRLF